MEDNKADALFTVSLATGEKRQLTNPPPFVLGDSNPAVSPDGSGLVFRRVPGGSAGELYWLPLGTHFAPAGEPTRLTSGTLDAAYPAWMPDGKEILFAPGLSPAASSAGGLWRLAIPSEEPPIRLPFVGENGTMPTISRALPDRPARLVYARSFSDMNIWRVDTPAPGTAASAAPVSAISSTQLDIVGDLSPDGRHVAFGSSRAGDRSQIWLAELDGSNAVQLTFTPSGVAAAPRWSPDGQLVAFQSNVEGQFEIYVIRASGGGVPRRITSHPANDHVPSFSRDGRWIYFSSLRSGDYQIWKVPTSGGDAVQVTHNGGFLALEGTDGVTLYYTDEPGGKPTTLWRIPASGGQPAKLVEGVMSSAFAVLQTGIYYVERVSDRARLQFYDFASGKSILVAGNLGDARPVLTASADGRTILYNKQDASLDDLMLVENFR
jgi:dipeptidyl aminopeptidase/acylaminoacyl peptidase